MKNQKGFLGPIGDDLPSLIPLLFALIIFFAAFTHTFRVYEEGNFKFQRAINIIRISSVIKGDSFIEDFEEFSESCESLNVTNLNYRAMLVGYEKLSDPDVSFAPQTLVQEANNWALSSADGKFVCPIDPADISVSQNEELFVRFYPVAYNDRSQKCGELGAAADPGVNCTVSGFVVRPSLLVVLAWS